MPPFQWPTLYTFIGYFTQKPLCLLLDIHQLFNHCYTTYGCVNIEPLHERLRKPYQPHFLLANNQLFYTKLISNGSIQVYKVKVPGKFCRPMHLSTEMHGHPTRFKNLNWWRSQCCTKETNQMVAVAF